MAKYIANKAGLKALARGDIAQSLVRTHAERRASTAGDGFIASYQQGASRFRAIIYADTWSAKRRNARDNTLVRVLG